ncbi:MAG: MBOAT family protein [Clostridia bacterium]|nr:MBOAT family protein [Clostridia bacterium]
MVFNSLEFLLYFPIVLLFYFLLPKKLTWIWLLAVSYWFYMSWNPELIVLILFTTVVSYAGGLIIEKSGKPAVRKGTLIGTILVCLGVLFFFKYFNFLGETVNGIVSLWGGGQPFRPLDLILPVGISFYTFQTLSYAIDVYRGTIPAEKHFGYYALYVSFFPQLVAGPIERPENLLPQLKEKHPLTRDDLRAGLRKMVVGYFKKVVVADLLAGYADRVFNAPGEASGFAVLLAALFFTFQIYCDFSGYTDIAIGCARVMGIRLMQNFNLPYTSKSIKEFWGRWHISLSSWFKDYLYIPLGGSRCSEARHALNVLIVFLVSGLWHGASWHFVLWGGLHGLYQMIGILLKKPRRALHEKLHIREDKGWYPAIETVFTFLLVAFAWLVFRANSTADLWILVKSLFTGWDFTAAPIRSGLSFMGLDAESLILCAAAVAVMDMMDKAERRCPDPTASGGEAAALPRTRLIPWTAAVWAVALAWIILASQGGSGTFIYFQF